MRIHQFQIRNGVRPFNNLILPIVWTPRRWRSSRNRIPLLTGPGYRTISSRRWPREESTLNTTRVLITIFPKRTVCSPGMRTGKQIATPMMHGGPTRRARVIQVSILTRLSSETLMPLTLRRFSIFAFHTSGFFNMNFPTAKASTCLNSAPAGEALQVSL